MANLVERAWEAEATAFGGQKWNVLTLGLSLLVNMIEHNGRNRQVLDTAVPMGNMSNVLSICSQGGAWVTANSKDRPRIHHVHGKCRKPLVEQ